VEGLRRLEYRGYDSTGVAINNGEGIVTHKTVGKVTDLKEILPDHIEGTTGIAHTRWATHGGVTQVNTHPHASSDGAVHLVHNGIIENFRHLRRHLSTSGIECVSETDSEVLVQLIAQELASGSTPLQSVQTTLKRVRGTWGVCIMFRDNDELICARNGSPLIIGQGQNEMFVSSDPHPLTSHTQRVIYLDDGDIAVLTPTSINMTSSVKGRQVEPNVTVLEEAWSESELGDAPHYMHKEIYEQPDALRQCIAGRMDREMGTGRLGGMRLGHETLMQAPHVRLLGCGTANIAAEIGQMLIEDGAHSRRHPHLERIPEQRPRHQP